MTRGLFFGWKVVAAAFTVAVFAWGFGFYGPPVFLLVLHDGRDWPISLISAAITTHYLLSAGLVAYIADLHRRFGLVAVTRLGALMLALGTLGWAFAAAPWQLFAASLLTGAGWAATSGAAIAAMVAPWFERRLGFALGLAFNGASIGGVLFTPLWAVLIERLGFPGAAGVLSLGLLAILWPVAGRYLGRTPEAMGLAVDGDAPATATHRPPPPRGAPTSRRDLFRQPQFVTLSGGFALGLFAQIGLISLLVSVLAPHFGASGAAAAVSLTTACAVLGRLLVGMLPGGRSWRAVAAANFAMQACGAFFLLGSTSAVGLLAGCVLFGLGVGNLVSLPPLIAQAEFDRSDVARVVALVTAVNQAVFSFAPGLFGALHDLAGGYWAPLLAAAALQAAAGGLVLVARIRT